MISPTQKGPTIVANGLPGTSQAFTIKATGKAFRILIDGLYEQKEAAVVREIMSNAWDSHAAAGKPETPISVTCPTQMDPIFRVRDFGVSMTHEEIMHLYTTIFESTKEATNEQIGQFGLGSKTPFAYTDTFSVTAWLDGEKRSYVAYVDDEDVPMINHVSTVPQPAHEPQGIEISVPVRPADLHTFRKEITRMVMGSDVQPEVDGMSLPKDVFLHQADGYRVVQDDYGMGSFAVRQGCVIYPSHQFSSQFINYGYTLIVDVPIGTVEVTANREALSLDDNTRAAIRSRLVEVHEQIEEYIEELNASFPNRLAAFQAYRTHDGWLRASIGRRTVALPPDRPNPKLPAQQIVAYRTKTKTQPMYQFQRTDDLIVLVDNGQPMLRRNLRIGEFYSVNRYKTVAVVKRDALPRLVRVLGLKKNQVRTLQGIPDVATARTATGPTGQAGRYAAPKKLGSNQIWMLKTGSKNINTKIGLAYIGYATDLTDAGVWKETLKALGIDADKIVFLTERQAEALGASESARLDVVLKKKAQEYAVKNRLQAKVEAEADRLLVESLNNYWQMDRITGQLPDALRRGVWTTYQRIIQGFMPSNAKGLTTVEQRIAHILEFEQKGALTTDVISAKVKDALKPVLVLAKKQDPMDILIQFYIDNN